MKRLICAALAAMLTLSLAACSANKNKAKSTDVPKNIRYRTVEPSDVPDYYEIKYSDPKAEEAYEETSAIIRGKPTAMSEVEISYIYGGEDRADYYTVLDFQIEEVYCDDSGTLKEGDTLKLMYVLSSYMTSKEAVTFKTDGDYVLFIRPVEGWDGNIFGFENIADYTIVYPMSLIVEKEGDGYDVKKLVQIFLDIDVDEDTDESQDGETGTGSEEEEEYTSFAPDQLKNLMKIIAEGKDD